MRNYVIINGVNSLTIQGLAIKTLPPITKPIQRNLREEIDGRDGDIVTTLGYGAYDKTIEIGLFGTFDIDEVIAFFNQKGTITFSNELDKVYNFQALEQVDYAELLKFRTANVVLHCQPFKYPTEETPLEEEYEYVTGTGTNVTLDNTSEAIFNKIDLLGNTEQTQYTGKNKLPTTSFTLVKGTNRTLQINFPTPIPAGTYTLSCKIVNKSGLTSSNGMAWALYDSSTTPATSRATFAQIIDSTTSPYSSTKTTNGQSTHLYIYLQNVLEDTATITIEDMQLEQNSSATSFEPYVGGIPSPSPSYPQPIQVVSGDNEINICGKNLFGLKQWLDTMEATYTENSDGSITFQAQTNLYNTTYPIKPTDRCLWSFKAKNGTGGNFRFRYVYEDGYINETAGSGTGTSEVSISTSSSTGHGNVVGIRSNWTTAGTFTVRESMLEQYIYGVSPQPYEPFQKQVFPINLGVENLIGLVNGTGTQNGITATTSDGEITLNGTATANSFVDIQLVQNYTLINGETYTISLNNEEANNNVSFRITGAGTYDTIANAVNKTNTITYDSSNAIFGNKITIRTSSGTTLTNFRLKPQIEKGGKANSFTPYGTTPIELCGIGDYKDKPFKAVNGDETYDSLTDAQKEALTSGSWYKYGAIGKVVLDSSKFNEKGTTGTNAYYISTTIADGLNDNTIASSMSDKFGMVAFNNRQNGLDVTYVQNGRIYIRTKNNTSLDWSTNQNCKDWLDANTPLIRYILATPTFTELTDEDLIAQLEATKQANSYDGQTNITQVSNDLPFMMEVSALKLGSDHLEINNTGNIYSKPTIELEGTGIVDIYLNDVQVFEVDLTEENKITIDTEKMEAYTDTGLANRKVTGDYSTFKLNVGTNDLRFSGALTSATITRYLRWL